MKSCVEIRLLVPRFVDLSLDAPEEREVRDHLRGCRACRALVAEGEPALGLAVAMTDEPFDDCDDFTAGVLAGVHQRSVERTLSSRRRRWLMSVAAAVLLLLGGAEIRQRIEAPTAPAPALVAEARPAVRPATGPASDPAFIEVEGEDVRVYQFASASKDAVQVAFIVDPHLEL